MAGKIQELVYFGCVFCAIFDFKSRLDPTEILGCSTGQRHRCAELAVQFIKQSVR